MAKPTGRRLKVFQAQFGFYDTVVAATSQAAALCAWGVHQNLFATGKAKVTTDAAAIAAAIAQPGTLLRRAVGLTDPFALEPTSLPKIPDSPKMPRVEPAAQMKAVARVRSPPDRSKLDGAKVALRDIDKRWEREEAEFRRQENELEASLRRPALITATYGIWG